MPSPPRRVKAHLIVKLFDGTTGETARLRARMLGSALVRRDGRGRATVDSRLAEDKGNPPKRVKP